MAVVVGGGGDALVIFSYLMQSRVGFLAWYMGCCGWALSISSRIFESCRHAKNKIKNDVRWLYLSHFQGILLAIK